MKSPSRTRFTIRFCCSVTPTMFAASNSLGLMFACSECEMSFNAKSRLDYHRSISHQGLMRFKLRGGSLVILERSADHRFHCPNESCNFETEAPSAIRRHFFSRHDPGKSVVNRKRLRSHAHIELVQVPADHSSQQEILLYRVCRINHSLSNENIVMLMLCTICHTALLPSAKTITSHIWKHIIADENDQFPSTSVKGMLWFHVKLSSTF